MTADHFKKAAAQHLLQNPKQLRSLLGLSHHQKPAQIHFFIHQRTRQKFPIRIHPRGPLAGILPVNLGCGLQPKTGGPRAGFAMKEREFAFGKSPPQKKVIKDANSCSHSFGRSELFKGQKILPHSFLKFFDNILSCHGPLLGVYDF